MPSNCGFFANDLTNHDGERGNAEPKPDHATNDDQRDRNQLVEQLIIVHGVALWMSCTSPAHRLRHATPEPAAGPATERLCALAVLVWLIRAASAIQILTQPLTAVYNLSLLACAPATCFSLAMSKSKESKARTYRFETELIDALEEVRQGQDIMPSETQVVKKALWAYIAQWRATQRRGK